RLFDIAADEYAHRGGSIPPFVLPCCAPVTSGNDPDGIPYGGGRADIRLAMGGDGEIYVLSKSDGMIRLVAGTGLVPALASANDPIPTTSTTLSVLGTDDGRGASLTYTWSTTGTPPAPVFFSPNGTNAARTTKATFSKAGPYAFLVKVTDTSGFSTTGNLAVTVQQTLTTVRVSLDTVTISAGGTQQFNATAYDQFNSAIVSQPAFTWSVTSGGGTVNSAGLFVAPGAAGTSVVTASTAGVSGSAAVTIQVPSPEAPTGLTAKV